jgi:hypothetical protein
VEVNVLANKKSQSRTVSASGVGNQPKDVKVTARGMKGSRGLKYLNMMHIAEHADLCSRRNTV